MPTIPQTESPLQAARAERARREAANYTCRTSQIAGSLVVFVINEPSQTIYTVNHLRRCNCDDFRKRCDGRGLVCKHVLLADRHLIGDEAPASSSDATATAAEVAAVLATDEARFAQARRDRELLWP